MNHVKVKLQYLAIAIVVMTAIIGCIKEDDGAATQQNLPQLNIENQTFLESDQDDTVSVKITLTGTRSANVVVKFGIIAGSATESLDFTLLSSGQLVFLPSENEKTLRVRVIGDEAKETAEKFEIVLYNPINATIMNDQGVCTITDDDDSTLGLVIPTSGYTTPTSYPGYNLAWADEFSADTLSSNWTFEQGAGGWGNNELQHYRSDNTSLVNGHLVITAKQQKFGGSDYTSSRLITKGKKQFKFGRIDIRAALPKGKGLWPALWMLGSNIDAVSWPSCGEIDIMELTGDLPTRVLGTAHYGANTSSHQFNSQSLYLTGNDNFQDAFHVFSINWEADKIEYLVDDQIFHTVTPATLNGAAYPFNKPFFFIFNVAVGGNLPGNPDGSTPWPQSMIVDYVRVFQK
jgi:beta-glucanase (GH16 family)